MVNKKPTNEPKADLIADFTSLEANINSAKKAPINGPIINPKGGIKSPMISPTIDPQIPYLDPPNFLVNATGSK